MDLLCNSLIIVDLQARIYEGNEPIQFFSIFQSFIVFKVWNNLHTKNWIFLSKVRVVHLKLSCQFSLLIDYRHQFALTDQGGLSDGYKKHITESELPDPTYTEDGLALFRVQGSGPENMQAIQLEPVSCALRFLLCIL